MSSSFLENSFSVPKNLVTENIISDDNPSIPFYTGLTVQTLDMPQALLPLTLCRDHELMAIFGYPPNPTICSSALRSYSSELWNSTVSAALSVSSASETDDVAFPFLLP